MTCGLTMKFNNEPDEFVQIIHNDQLQWLTISTVGTLHPEVMLCDSLYSTIPTQAKEEIASLIATQQPNLTVKFMDVQMLSGSSDCGLFTIACATALSFSYHLECLSCGRDMNGGLVEDMDGGCLGGGCGRWLDVDGGLVDDVDVDSGLEEDVGSGSSSILGWRYYLVLNCRWQIVLSNLWLWKEGETSTIGQKCTVGIVNTEIFHV